MSSIIEDLYYGNIPLSERDFKRNSEYAHVLLLATRNEDKLVETLTEAQKETFEKLKDTMLHEFVEKIMVYQAQKDEYGHRVQRIKIYYNFIGGTLVPAGF